MVRSAKEQKLLIMDFCDTLLLKNSVRGRNAEEPLDYEKSMDVAKQVLQKHGFNNSVNIYAADPYSGAVEKRSEKDKLVEQLQAKVRWSRGWFHPVLWLYCR